MVKAKITKSNSEKHQQQQQQNTPANSINYQRISTCRTELLWFLYFTSGSQPFNQPMILAIRCLCSMWRSFSCSLVCSCVWALVRLYVRMTFWWCCRHHRRGCCCYCCKLIKKIWQRKKNGIDTIWVLGIVKIFIIFFSHPLVYILSPSLSRLFYLAHTFC